MLIAGTNGGASHESLLSLPSCWSPLVSGGTGLLPPLLNSQLHSACSPVDRCVRCTEENALPPSVPPSLLFFPYSSDIFILPPEDQGTCWVLRHEGLAVRVGPLLPSRSSGWEQVPLFAESSCYTPPQSPHFPRLSPLLLCFETRPCSVAQAYSSSCLEH